MQKALMFVKLFHESFRFAVNAIIVNKLRTILSLSGITIGIFAIITVFTIFDSMESEIRKSISALGSNVLFVQKWPWSMGGEYPWWKYFNRPEPNLDDLKAIQRQSRTAEASAYMMGVERTVKRGNNAIEGVTIIGVSQDYDKVMEVNIADGRFFTPIESMNGHSVCLLGAEVAENLFPGGDPMGKDIKVFGQRFHVIGVLVKEGEDMFSNSGDNQVIVPVNFTRNLFDLRQTDGTIAVRAREGISNDEMRDELTGILRSARKLKPRADDDFAINETDLISKGFDQLFGVIALVGWIIGGFSLLVGGFGIANIMFVSVRERTSIIGIEKALGAKRYFILLEFLFEAVILSLIGGLLGLLLVFGITFVISQAMNMEVTLSIFNIILGLGVSFFIGLVSGIVPAMVASRLNPVVAIRSNG
ncbi:MAG TPA: ABC transporter permease [Bacteroidales bacterium]|nr:ABC transporter permease [Bacteroidales bacterium]HRZ77043.1 ABC transporter permease [Bacteroidales bacterium]